MPRARALLAVLVGFALALARSGVAAPPPEHADEMLTKPQPIDEKYPLPQDPEKAKKLRAARLDEVRKATVEVFNARGNAKAAWAPQARLALSKFAEVLSQDRGQPEVLGEDASGV
jgi:hypothetical protein